MAAKSFCRIVAVAGLALATSGCGTIQKVLGIEQELCSIIVSKEEGSKRVCQMGTRYRVDAVPQDDSIDAATRENHLHIALALVPGKVVSVYYRAPDRVQEFAHSAAESENR